MMRAHDETVLRGVLSMKPVALVLLLLAGCTSPALTANIGIGAGGVTLTPAISTNVGGVNVTASP
jgi:hypothetical protein